MEHGPDLTAAVSRAVDPMSLMQRVTDRTLELIDVSEGVMVGLADDDGVTGLDVRTADGSRRRVEAPSTLLATGGYQGDHELTAALIHEQAPLMPLRSNPTSAGTGLRLGESAGAAFGKEDAGFYGHLVLADVPLDDPMQFANQTLYYSEHALVFNRDGQRFIDETLGDSIERDPRLTDEASPKEREG